MKIRLSTVMMTSRKKGTLSWGFHQMTLKVEVIEYPHDKIMAHHQARMGEGGGGWMLHNLNDESDRNGAKIKVKIKFLDQKLTPETPVPNFQALKIPTMD